MASLLKVAEESGVWTLTLSRPEKRNALSAGLVEDLIDSIARAHASHARALVFCGAGSNFSAGFDFSAYENTSEGDLVLRFVRIEQMLQAIASSPCATFAFAQGKNFGAGVDLIAACRTRIAAPNATFRMPGLKFGLVLGTRRFGAIVGADKARRILEASNTFGAEEASAMGFVHKIAEQGSWPGEISAALQTAGALDPDSHSALTRVLSANNHDADMAELVRSAARPGLKTRIARYLASS